MPRGTSSKTRRVSVQETVGDTTVLQPRTQVSAQAGSGGAEAAFALADALKGGVDLLERRDKDKATQAAADFQRGAVNDDERNRSYRRTVDTLKARANWIQDEAEFDEAFEDIDVRDMTLEGLNQALDGIFSAKYGNLDSEHIAEEIVPRMAAYRQRKIEETLKIQDEAEVAEIATSATMIAEDAYKKGFQPDGSHVFDYDDMNNTIQEAYPGAQGNELLLAIYGDIAVRNGDGDFLRNVPERWADGTPTFMSDAAFNEKVLAFETRADAVAKANAAADAKAQTDADAELRRVTGIATVDAAAQGDYDLARGLADHYRGLPGAEVTEAIALEKAADSLANISEERGANERLTGIITAGVYSGEFGRKEIFQEYLADTFGTGKQAVDRMRILLAVATSNENRGSEGSAKDYNVYASSIRDWLKPDRLVGTYDETLSSLQNNALREFHEKTERGMSPMDANLEIREKYAPMADRSLNVKQDQAFTPTEAALEVFQGRMDGFTAAQFGLDVETVDALVDAKSLTVEQATQIINKLP